MYNEWSLEALYKGIEDPKLAEDMARLAEVIAAYAYFLFLFMAMSSYFIFLFSIHLTEADCRAIV